MAEQGLSEENPRSEELLTEATHRAVDKAALMAFERHGPLAPDPVRAGAILGREWGEAMNEALLATVVHNREQSHVPPDSRYRAWAGHDNALQEAARARLYIELGQVAATAMLMMENLKKEGAA